MLDGWIRSQIATVPEDRRKAITGHNSFHYFARAYGVTFESPRGYNTGSEPSARDMANLIRQVREQKIKALFIENMTNPVLVDEIARDSGATVGPRLYSDALSKPGGPAPTYEAMMRLQRGRAGRGNVEELILSSRTRRRRTAGRRCGVPPAGCCTSGRPRSSGRRRPARG